MGTARPPLAPPEGALPDRAAAPETLLDHRRIFAAIAGRDPAGARSAMRAHLERVTRTFSRG
ncbi:FCD domain-containing protein [Massilia sp. Dwa41.01b]|uniref:FCD domain-containing protein n=1 Tax=Massilia sp. Dwa41.01b TaxID=2709302 RepID=UPI0022772166|nr:FCD domain-containing protein [Massilia sp. Dwa41.01b]